MHKKLAILGAGESGVGAALLAQAKGWDVFVSDANDIAASYQATLRTHHIAFETQQHSPHQILTADTVVKSPGIPNNASIIQRIKQHGIPIIDEIEFASRYTKALLVGITGTNGKTTTTHLTHHLLTTAGYNVDVAGNIGASFAKKVLTTPKDYYILELSSFQLEGMHTCKLAIACLLNITPDHLDRYAGGITSYVATKFRILQNMTTQDHFIYCQADTHIQAYLQQHQMLPQQHPITLQSHRSHDDTPYTWLPTNNPALQGMHNQLNALVAVQTAQILGIHPAYIKTGLATFTGVPHRIEWVTNMGDVDFYNDTKATNVAATYAALTRFTRPIIWIAGGMDKGNDYTILQPLAKAYVKAMICLGKRNAKIKEAFQHIVAPIYETQDMKEAVAMAINLAKANDVVLFSPACASFDLFKNFEERGNHFRQAVKQAKMTTLS